MVTIALVEDDQDTSSRMRQMICQFFGENKEECQVSSFSSADSFLASFHKNYDLVFMDIDLPGTDGLTASRKLREIDKDVMVIFVTFLAQLAIKGYEVNAFDFIVKPVAYPDFRMKMTRVLAQLNAVHERSLVIRNKDSVRRILVSDIRYIEVRNHTVTYHLLDQDIRSYGVLYKIQDDLKGLPFSLCNQCYLVNLRYVTAIEDFTVYLGKTPLQLSHLKKKTFVRDLNCFLSAGGNPCIS
jgi:two-component system response regulator LytT